MRGFVFTQTFDFKPPSTKDLLISLVKTSIPNLLRLELRAARQHTRTDAFNTGQPHASTQSVNGLERRRPTCHSAPALQTQQAACRAQDTTRQHHIRLAPAWDEDTREDRVEVAVPGCRSPIQYGAQRQQHSFFYRFVVICTYKPKEVLGQWYTSFMEDLFLSVYREEKAYKRPETSFFFFCWIFHIVRHFFVSIYITICS
jgi:hypothetical protein